MISNYSKASQGALFINSEFYAAQRMALDASFTPKPEDHIANTPGLTEGRAEVALELAITYRTARTHALKLLEQPAPEGLVTNAQDFAVELLWGVGELCCHRFIAGRDETYDGDRRTPGWGHAYLLGPPNGLTRRGKPNYSVFARVSRNRTADGGLTDLRLGAIEDPLTEQECNHRLEASLAEGELAVAYVRRRGEGGVRSFAEGHQFNSTLQFLSTRITEGINLFGSRFHDFDFTAKGMAALDLLQRQTLSQ